ncbi:TLD-domain-containing protein [Coniochaeta sp. 2T2.1]|nr:TLD-domain-containing protein [Coniochaeta sp. 2T2.1]
MGQSQSGEQVAPPSHEEVSQQLALKFAQKCFTSLELYSLKDVFKSLADNEQHVRYLKEDTIARFLEIPDVLAVSPVIFQMVSYVGAFPFLQDAPAVLGLEQMIMVVTIMTERYRRVLAKGATDRRKLLFNSLAVYDKKLSQIAGGVEKEEQKANEDQPADADSVSKSHAAGFAVDEPGEDEDETPGEEDDELVLAAFASMDYIDAFKQESRHTSHGAMIPADNFRKLIMLLLLVAPLEPQESIAVHAARLAGDELENLRSTAECVLAALLNVETSPGIRFHRFNAIIPASLPYLFNGFNNLFERFLFSKNLDLNKHRDDDGQGKTAKAAPADALKSLAPSDIPQPLLQDQASIMNLNILSQLSFFLPGASLFRRLCLLYSGDNDGFSMGSFESKVFNWRAPTILLVRGTRLVESPSGPGYHASPGGSSAEAAFTSTLPPRRFPVGGSSKDSSSSDEQLTFGVYIPEPWRHTHREAFGGDETTLFQLEPIHDVFRTSSLNTDRATFSKPSPSTLHPGITFGCPVQGGTSTSRAHSHHSASSSPLLDLGPVSLVLDSSFEFGAFTHDFRSRGGAFHTSVARKFDFQERFAVESLEIWGCGGDEEAKVQAERWAWEAREAEARRRINLGTGDIEADRALLEMAGLIGGNRSGGSMG